MEQKIQLKESDIPRQWYNLAADLPTPLQPPLGPDGKPVTPDMLAPVFPMNLIEQEVSTQRWIDIPRGDPGHPVPLAADARCTAPSTSRRHLKTPARIYYKNESVSPPGSHKPNTAVPQAWYNKQFGIKRLTTETGAGQWGSALAFACALIGLECKVFMVRISFDQKPFRKLMMQIWGAKCVASPSTETNAGRADPGRDARHARQPGHRHQRGHRGGRHRPHGQDPLLASAACSTTSCCTRRSSAWRPRSSCRRPARRLPDIVIGCAGGGSNFAGLAFPFVGRQDQRRQDRDHPGRAGRLPDDDPRAVRATTTATPPA